MVNGTTHHVKLHHASLFSRQSIFYVWRPFYSFRLPKGDFEKHWVGALKWRVKKNNSALLAKMYLFMMPGILLYALFCLWGSRNCKGLESGQFSRILWAMFPRSYLWKSTKRLNIMIQMKLAKIEIYRSKKT